MMPKGVEHIVNRVKYGTIIDVRIPMMPKGVEHRLRQVLVSENQL